MKESKELKISKEAVLEASMACPDAKAVLKALFPDVFKEEWLPITHEIEWKFRNEGDDYGVVEIYHHGSFLGSLMGDGTLHVVASGYKGSKGECSMHLKVLKKAKQ